VSTVGHSFSVIICLSTASGLIPASASFAYSEFPVHDPYPVGFPPIKAVRSPGKQKPSLLGAPENGAEKRRHFHVYLNSVNESSDWLERPRAAVKARKQRFKIPPSFRRHANAPGKKRRRRWVSKVEWNRIAVFRPRLDEAVLTKHKKGRSCASRRIICSSTYEQANGKARRPRPRRSLVVRFAPI